MKRVRWSVCRGLVLQGAPSLPAGDGARPVAGGEGGEGGEGAGWAPPEREPFTAVIMLECKIGLHVSAVAAAAPAPHSHAPRDPA